MSEQKEIIDPSPENDQKAKRPVNYFGLGLIFGVGIGAALGNVAVGIAVGVAIGAILNSYYKEQRANKEDEEDGT